MTRAAIVLLGTLPLWLGSGGCRRAEPRKLHPVDALKAGVKLAFRPPADGLVTDAMIETFLQVRRQSRSQSEGEALRATGADPVEFAWVRARVLEALLALDSGRVTAAAGESYNRSLATAREARRLARDPKAIARLDSEIAALERERAALRKGSPFPAPLLRNAARVAARRSEIEAVRP